MAQAKRGEDFEKTKGSPDNFTGNVFIQNTGKVEEGATVLRVTFEKGAHTFWHKHTGRQVLYFLEGKGRVQLRGQEVINAVSGDVVQIPPNTDHWHGAHPEETDHMSHLAITSGELTWEEPVADGEYTAK